MPESAAAVQDAVEAFTRELTPQTRADADAACRDYVQRLAPVIGEVVVAFRYEASIRAFGRTRERPAQGSHKNGRTQPLPATVIHASC